MEKKSTQMLKGVAVCLLLFHHLFLNTQPTSGIMIGNEYLANMIAPYFKVCVAIFLILSGYGMNASMNKNHYPLKYFYKKNIFKIYRNYWLIWVLFVPIGLLRGRTFQLIYGSDWIKKLITDVLGLQKLIVGYQSYNPTWWFITLILGLYLIFPILYKLVKKIPLVVIILAIAAMFLPNIKFWGHIHIIFTYKYWLLPFIFGMILSEYKVFEKMDDVLNGKKILKFILYFGLLVLTVYIRKNGIYFSNLKIDTLFAFSIMLISLEYLRKLQWLNKALQVLGKHSFNIFLFHTFIYSMYLHDFIYSFKYPLLIWFALLFISLDISIWLEKLKAILARKRIIFT